MDTNSNTTRTDDQMHELINSFDQTACKISSKFKPTKRDNALGKRLDNLLKFCLTFSQFDGHHLLKPGNSNADKLDKLETFFKTF